VAKKRRDSTRGIFGGKLIACDNSETERSDSCGSTDYAVLKINSREQSETVKSGKHWRIVSKLM
jgi:hypothetical protein